MKIRISSCFWALASAGLAAAQTTPAQIRRILEPPLVAPEVVVYQLRSALLKKAPPLPSVSSGQEWTRRSGQLRRELLDSVVFHGWPREWVAAPAKFEDLGLIPSGQGIRMRKLRYEIVPGFWSSAILYEPEVMSGKVPAILNVNGHVGPPGKAIEYKQKRCINQAKQGILSLNLEWFFFGELEGPENQHWFAAHLDLVGANGVGLFYLAMRKGLDYLYNHPSADRARLGVTGLSGGGWQTILLSALDERVFASAPVAGYSSLVSRVERAQDTGDIEQNPTDMLAHLDFPHLTAMRAPKPTLLMYNAEDDCCFRAALVKPYVYDQVRPFFKLYDAEARFGWHENTDPADHNYQLDNRLQSYRFFTQSFGLPIVEKEAAVDSEIKTREELLVGLPADNLTILGLAKRFAERAERRPMQPSEARDQLKRILRYQPARIEQAWAIGNSKNKGLESRSYRFDFDSGLSAAGVWLKSIASAESGPASIILNDEGKKAAHSDVSERVNRGEQVLALDLVFTGDSAPRNPGPSNFTQMLAATGERPLGIETAQLISAARWLQIRSGSGAIRIRTTGVRSQLVALTAAALEPDLFQDATYRNGISSLRHLLDKPITYQDAPDLFCLDLYRYFDIDSLRALGRSSEGMRNRLPHRD